MQFKKQDNTLSPFQKMSDATAALAHSRFPRFLVITSCAAVGAALLIALCTKHEKHSLPNEWVSAHARYPKK